MFSPLPPCRLSWGTLCFHALLSVQVSSAPAVWTDLTAQEGFTDILYKVRLAWTWAETQ
jgi:hypothetical protein